MLAVAEWLRRRAVTPATRVRFSPVNPVLQSTEFIGRSVSGKPSVFEADFGRSIRPLPATAGSFSGRTPLSDSRCRWFESIPGCHFVTRFKRVSFKGQDRTLRTFRLPFESAYPCHPAFVQLGEDTALRTLKFRFESGGLDQFCAVVAEWQRRPIVYRDQEGSTPFHRASFRGSRGAAPCAAAGLIGPLLFRSGCEAHQDEQAALNRQAERSIRSAPTRFVLG